MNGPDSPAAQFVGPPELRSYGVIADIPVTLRAELDRRCIRVRDLLKLEIDSVVPLTRPAGENIDLYLGRILIGSGEILVVEGVMALRVADLRDKGAEMAHSIAAEQDPL